MILEHVAEEASTCDHERVVQNIQSGRRKLISTALLDSSLDTEYI